MFSFKAKILFHKNHFGIKRGGGRTSANVEDMSQTKSNNNKKEKGAKNMTNIFLLDESNNMSSQHFCCSQNISLGKIIRHV